MVINKTFAETRKDNRDAVTTGKTGALQNDHLDFISHVVPGCPITVSTDLEAKTLKRRKTLSRK